MSSPRCGMRFTALIACRSVFFIALPLQLVLKPKSPEGAATNTVRRTLKRITLAQFSRWADVYLLVNGSTSRVRLLLRVIGGGAARTEGANHSPRLRPDSPNTQPQQARKAIGVAARRNPQRTHLASVGGGSSANHSP